MSWSAAVFGDLRFPSPAKVKAWRKRRCDSAAWDDWVGELAHDERGSTQVGELLDALGNAVSTKGAKVTVRIEQIEEDGFRDDAAQMAAAFRVAEADGAEGDVYFVGGYGAMGDFAYQLHLEGGASRVRAIPKKLRPAIYALPGARELFEMTPAELAARPTTDFDEFVRMGEVPRRILEASFTNLIQLGRLGRLDPRWGAAALRVATTPPEDETSWFALLVAAYAKHPKAFGAIKRRIGTVPVLAIAQAFEALRDPAAIPILQALPATALEKKYGVKAALEKLRRAAK